MAQLLLESMESDWDPDEVHDTHRQKVEAIIEEKRQGNEVVAQVTSEPAAPKVVDLMEVLSASIDSVKSRARTAPVRRTTEEGPSPPRRPSAAKKQPRQVKAVKTGAEKGGAQGPGPPKGVVTTVLIRRSAGGHPRPVGKREVHTR